MKRITIKKSEMRIYNLIITAKDGKEGYVFDLLDKILGIAKNMD